MSDADTDNAQRRGPVKMLVTGRVIAAAVPEGEAGERVYSSDPIPLPTTDEDSVAVLIVSQDITESVRERTRRERIMRQLVDTLVSVVDRRAVSALVNYLENRGGREEWESFGALVSDPSI